MAQGATFAELMQAEESAAKNAEALDRATENSSQTPSGGGGGDGGLSDGVVGAIAGTVGFIALVLIVSATAILLSRRHGRAKDESDLKATEGGGYPARPYSLSTPSALKASQRSIDQSLSNSDPRRNRSVSSTEWTSLRALELGTPGTVGGSLLGRSYARGTASSITGGADATAFTMASLSSEATMAGGTWRQQLLRALNNMRVARPPQPFAGRYLLLRERAGGGQAVIAFARDREGGYFQVRPFGHAGVRALRPLTPTSSVFGLLALGAACIDDSASPRLGHALPWGFVHPGATSKSSCAQSTYHRSAACSTR